MARAMAAFCVSAIIALPQNTPGDDFELYKKQVETNPRNSLAHYRLGEIFLQRYNYQAAANEFREALNGDQQPSWIKPQAHINLGRIFNATGQFERASNEFQQAGKAFFKNELPAPPGVYRVSDGAVAPVAIERAEAEYSDEGRRAELEGTVTLAVIVGENGRTRDAWVTGSLGLGLDESALAAVKNWRFVPGAYEGRSVPVISSFEIDFTLPSKQSRWHLIRAAFYPPPRVSRPVFLTTSFPPGVGVSARAIDEGKLVGAIGRLGTATLSFDIDEHGVPARMQVEKASDPLWGDEAIAVVRDWRFGPGVRDGTAVAVPCTLDLTWGPRKLTWSSLSWARNQLAVAKNSEPPPWESSHTPGVHRIRVGSAVQAAKLITRVAPVLPEEAKQSGIVASVFFNVLIGADGRVSDVQLISGHPMLVSAATAALKQWVYEQTLLNGRPAEVTTEVEVEFPH